LHAIRREHCFSLLWNISSKTEEFMAYLKSVVTAVLVCSNHTPFTRSLEDTHVIVSSALKSLLGSVVRFGLVFYLDCHYILSFHCERNEDHFIILSQEIKHNLIYFELKQRNRSFLTYCALRIFMTMKAT
jgi:hypothetical protein